MTTTSPRVLIASPNHSARVFLADNLEADGYLADGVPDIAAAWERLAEPLDVLIADTGVNTLDLVDAIRTGAPAAVDTQLPIIALVADASDIHRTRLLERGADDVVTTPYSYPELRARLGALLRRSTARQSPHVLRAGSLRLDVRARRAWVGGVETEPLREKEYQLLRTLIAEPERVYTREELLRTIWGHGPAARTRTLDSHAARLRSRLRIGAEQYVHNVWGVGYRLHNGDVGCA